MRRTGRATRVRRGRRMWTGWGRLVDRVEGEDGELFAHRRLQGRVRPAGGHRQAGRMLCGAAAAVNRAPQAAKDARPRPVLVRQPSPKSLSLAAVTARALSWCDDSLPAAPAAPSLQERLVDRDRQDGHADRLMARGVAGDALGCSRMKRDRGEHRVAQAAVDLRRIAEPPAPHLCGDASLSGATPVAA